MREATHCHNCHLISCVYIKGLVNTEDQSNACMCENDVEGVKRSLNSFNCYSCYSSQKSRKWCLQLLCNTAYRVLNLLLMSKGSKVSNTMYFTLYTEPLSPPRGKAIYFKAFRLVGLAVHHQSVRGGSFVNFLGLVIYKGDCRQDA